MTNFEKASGIILTEQWTRSEYEKALDDGRYVPVSENFENWDPEAIETLINDICELLDKKDKEYENLVNIGHT